MRIGCEKARLGQPQKLPHQKRQQQPSVFRREVLILDNPVLGCAGGGLTLLGMKDQLEGPEGDHASRDRRQRTQEREPVPGNDLPPLGGE